VLGILDSSRVVLAIVFGVPLAVALALAIGVSRPGRGPVMAGAVVVFLAVVAVSAWAIGKTPTSEGSGFAAAPVLPPVAPSSGGQSVAPQSTPSAVQTPTGPPPLSSTPLASPSPGSVPSNGPCHPTGTSVKETAKAIAFTKTCLAAPGNTAFTIRFDNADPGTPHNIHIFSADPAAQPGAQSLFMGEIVTGPTTTTYTVPALPPGTYYFHCDVHPTMNGTVTVK
jgi:plastocyanin